MVHAGNGISVNLGWGSKTKPHQLKVCKRNTTLSPSTSPAGHRVHECVPDFQLQCSDHAQGRNKADKELEAIAKAEVRPIDDWDLVMDSRNRCLRYYSLTKLLPPALLSARCSLRSGCLGHWLSSVCACSGPQPDKGPAPLHPQGNQQGRWWSG
jgi:hypothetical protein